MTKTQRNIQESLSSSAQLVRKYNLGDKDYFFSKFNKIDKTKLETAWTFALRTIQNKEIVKDASHLQNAEKEIANEKALGFDFGGETLLYYLNSQFEPKELKLIDENIERKLRTILANRYVDFVANEIELSAIKLKPTPKNKTTFFFQIFKVALIILGILGVFSAPRIIDGLTPVDTLAEKIHEKSKRKFNGAVCNDGKISHSQGPGTCSWHDGVAYKFYEGDYSKSKEDCRREAEKISWRN